MLRPYPRLSHGYDVLFPRGMTSPHPYFCHPGRDFFGEIPQTHYYARYSPFVNRFAVRRDEDEEMCEPSSPPQQASGPVRIPINFSRHALPAHAVAPAPRSSPPRISPSSSSPQSRVAAFDAPAYRATQTASVPVRIALRLAEETPKSKEEEIAKREKRRMQSRLQLYGLVEHDVKGDGNCQFRALSDQVMRTQDNYARVRSLIVDWLRQNADYRIDPTTCLKDFLQEEIFPTWEDYCDAMSQDQVWGDHITLIAAAEVFRTKIWILSSIDLPDDGKLSPVTIVEPREVQEGRRCIFLGHWHERHYTSLIPEEEEQYRRRA